MVTVLGNKLFEKKYPAHCTEVQIGNLRLGQGFAIFAGPCAVESQEAIAELGAQIAENTDVFRGGVFKARTSPYSFSGLGEEGISYLTDVGKAYQKPVLIEFLEPDHAVKYSERVDMIQIGARNMYNYPLLQRAAMTKKPILLKRHFSATLDELLHAAEYILELGNPQVVLCERGIRTFEPRYRNCLDLSGVVLLKQITHLPVIVDPSHAAGDSSMVEKLSLAAAAIGADGLIVEVHQKPISSRSDAPQAISPSQLADLRIKVEKILGIIHE